MIWCVLSNCWPYPSPYLATANVPSHSSCKVEIPTDDLWTQPAVPKLFELLPRTSRCPTCLNHCPGGKWAFAQRPCCRYRCQSPGWNQFHFWLNSVDSCKPTIRTTTRTSWKIMFQYPKTARSCTIGPTLGDLLLIEVWSILAVQNGFQGVTAKCDQATP